MNAPAAGRALAEWIVHGQPSVVDITFLGAERLVGGAETGPIQGGA